MQPLVIEYSFEGHQRGYNYSSPTHGYSDEELKAIWRQAMPRGQGWSDFVGATSLKCFALDRSVAVCETEITALRDEHGRGGIRRTVIEILSQADYRDWLQARLDDLPDPIGLSLQRLPTLRQRMAIANKTLPGPRREQQLVVTAGYESPESWRLVEGLLLKLALDPVGPMKRWDRLIPFTTLALSHQGESALVALPVPFATKLKPRTALLRL
jgi:hypothetical protein